MNDQPHEGHHDCYGPVAAKLTTQRFVALLNEHPELHDLDQLDSARLVIYTEEEE